MQCVGRFKLSRNQGSSQLAKPRDSRSVLVVAEVGAFTGAAIFSRSASRQGSAAPFPSSACREALFLLHFPLITNKWTSCYETRTDTSVYHSPGFDQ